MGTRSGTVVIRGWLLTLLLLLAGCGGTAYENVSSAQLKELMAQGVPLIDIRTSREWRETGVVPGSHKITFFEDSGRVNPRFFDRMEEIVADPAQPLAIICRTGNRTAALARVLANEMGYTRVYNVERGITEWIGTRNPVDKG